ncbi:MAG TPA: hypothetical protein VH206_19725 [Xanthobacteraceae bacterium]|jgi:hypothetical protein|nr:hypothetical protein [Xanthobacteraceae bacterium]
MTTLKQLQANRRNARKSTGPKTEPGKRRSRCNAIRHGLAAETVIGSLEDAEDYQAFESAIIADYAPQSAVERELILRLASLLWRLRRATAMETGVFEIDASMAKKKKASDQRSREVIRALLSPVGMQASAEAQSSVVISVGPAKKAARGDPPLTDFGESYLRVANMPNFAFDRLNRYEVGLWRQVGQLLLTLEALDRRKPQERKRRYPWSRELGEGLVEPAD